MKCMLIAFIFVTLSKLCASDCGFPGIPNGADIENLEDLKYYENTTVIYRCKNPKDRTLSLVHDDLADRDPFTGYMRTCFKGKWFEPLPRCAKDVSENVKISTVKVYDQRTFQMLLEIPKDLNNLTNSANLIRGNCIRLRYNHASNWFIAFESKALVSYYEIDIKQENMQEMSVENHHLFKMITSKYRNCHLSSIKKVTRFQETGFKGALHPFIEKHATPKRGSRAFFVHIVGFLCSMRPEYADENHEPYFTNQINLTVNLTSNISICEIRAYQPPPLRCGRPEVPFQGDVAITSLNGVDKATEPIKSGRDAIRWRDKANYKCNSGHELVTDNTYKTNDNAVLFSPDSIWTGTVPLCKPKVQCRLDDIDNDVNLNHEIKDVVYYNQTVIAAPGTTIQFSCKNVNGSSNVTHLLGDQARQCLATGLWSTEKPSCVQVVSSAESHEAGTYSVLYTLTAALVITLVVGSVFVATAFVYFFKKFKRNVAREADETTSRFKSSTFASSSSLQGDKIYEEIAEYAAYDVYETIEDVPEITELPAKASTLNDYNSTRKDSVKRKSIYANQSVIYDDIQLEFSQSSPKRRLSMKK